jgi:hypothetical protein
MTIDLYYIPASAPCRSVLLTANAVGVQLNLKYVDLFKGEHLTPEFLKVRNLTKKRYSRLNSNFMFYKKKIAALGLTYIELYRG